MTAKEEMLRLGLAVHCEKREQDYVVVLRGKVYVRAPSAFAAWKTAQRKFARAVDRDTRR